MKLVSVIAPCLNEEGNVAELHQRIVAAFANLPQYRFELIFIDNHSSDGTVARIKELVAADARVRLIVNARNFGQVRSPHHALLQARGDAIIAMSSDLQDPPELIPALLAQWEAGFKVVAAVRASSQEFLPMRFVRRAYYRLIDRISEVRVIRNFTGFGLYDRRVIEITRRLEDPNPYFRGLISEIGFPVAEVPFDQPRRKRGLTKNNLYTLYDLAMLGITSHSRAPIRIATIAGFALSAVSILISLTYLVLKLLYWNLFAFGTAPVLIALFFSMSVQLFFIGLLGEYISAIHTRVMRRPLVVEQERVNFEQQPERLPPELAADEAE